MQQYGVPQFTDIEDKIVGPFTIKQFLVMVGGAAIILLFWLLFGLSIIFFVLALPTALVTLFISLGTMNGRSVLSNFFPALAYFTTPKRLLFHRGSNDGIVQIQTIVQKAVDTGPSPQEVRSRLNRLAYVLDQKSEIESRVHSSANPASGPDR